MGCGQSVDDQDNREKRANKDYHSTIMFLSKVPLLRRLSLTQHPLLASASDLAEFNAGDIVIQQGDLGTELFVVYDGQAIVQVAEAGAEPKVVATLKSGDYFGDQALLREEPRNATVTASTKLTVLKISRDRFQGLGLHNKLQFPHRRAVVAGAQKVGEVKEPSPKTEADVALIVKALKGNKNLMTMLDDKLDESRARQFAESAWIESVSQGTDVITEGDLEADYFYIVAEGTFEVVQASTGVDGLNTGNGSSTQVSVIPAGGSFGELAMLYFAPRAATVKSITDAKVWVMDRGDFKNILMKMSVEKVEQYEGYLSHVEVFNSLLADERQAIAGAMIEKQLSRGEVILKQGELGSTFYILCDGAVSIAKDGVETAKMAACESGGIAHLFGERALLKNEPRAATVTVTSDKAKALVLDRDSFNLLLGPLQDIIEARSGAATTQSRRLSMVGSWMRTGGAGKKVILKKELQRVGLLGCGGFGVVELWQHRSSRDTYALKGISKGWIVKTGTQELVMNEKNILFRLNSPFIIKLHATYNGSQTLYFLLEAALGGELCATYRREGFHGSHGHAKFYAAAVVFAFEHCHERRVIYRDLKPENLILTNTGNIKLTDMGLAKFAIGKTYTTCGTPDYFSPEMIQSSGHGLAVDWWTLGILLFELLSGHAPFETPNIMQMYSKIMKGIDSVTFPDACKGDSEVLIKALLRKDPSERLPLRSGGTQNIKDVQWYGGFDWDSMETLSLEPPFVPEVKGNADVANFSQEAEDMPTHLPYTDDGTGWDKDFAS